MAHYDLQTLINYFKVDSPHASVLNSLLFNRNQKINQLRLDSRLVELNDVFIALKGHRVDGKAFIPQAIKLGAIAILIETEDKLADKTISYYSLHTDLANDKKIPLIYIYELAKKLSAFANHFYDHPSDKIHVIGVTGTNGKTTVTQLIAGWATLLGEKSAVLGTLGNGLYNQLTPSTNTTSSPIDIQSYLADFYQQGVKLVAMEVSSHGLALDRVKDLSFSASLFTNLSRDHLDFHETMIAYQQAKWSLFSPSADERAVKKAGSRIINFDDEVGREWIEQLANVADVIVVSAIPDNLPVIRALGRSYIAVSKLVYHDQGGLIYFETNFDDRSDSGELKSHLLGAFNVSNLLLAFAVLVALGFPIKTLVNTAPLLPCVCGRMEFFSAKNKPTVIVDYAHTPDALDKVLSAAKTHCQGLLWVIFGCGGERDKGKRPLMAAVAEIYSQNIIVTNDNPREEDPDEIIQDITRGFKAPNGVQVIKDRAQAIRQAINRASEDDMIVVAGKGHEDYQIIGKKHHHYSDRETVCHLLGISL